MKVVHEKAFNKGLERLKKSGDMPRVGPHLAKVTDTLGTGKHPDPVYGHHELKGKGKGIFDCHLVNRPDWILIYRFDGDTVRFICLGSHPKCLSKYKS